MALRKGQGRGNVGMVLSWETEKSRDIQRVSLSSQTVSKASLRSYEGGCCCRPELRVGGAAMGKGPRVIRNYGPFVWERPGARMSPREARWA